MTRRLATVVALLVGLMGLSVALAAPALAHASVVSSDPADGSRLTTAPRAVTVTFDENVGLGGIGYLHVTNSAGRRVDAAPAFHPGGDGSKVTDRLEGHLGDGSFTASFRVVSADSHPVAGTIAFVVGNGALVHGSLSMSATNGDTATAFDVVRWVSYIGVALLGGMWLILSIWPAGAEDRRAMTVGWIGAGLVALGSVLELFVQGAFAAGESLDRMTDTGLLADTVRSSYGQLHVARLVLLILLTFVLRYAFTQRSRLRSSRWVVVLLALGVVATFSAAGHPGTTSPAELSVPVDMLHLIAMATWLGGLVVLLIAVLPRARTDELRTVLPVFSRVAFVSIVVLAATGTYSAWRGVGTVQALFTTSYGLLVVGKILLFVGIVALGNLSRGIVRRRFTPRVVALAMTNAALEPASPAADDTAGNRPRDHNPIEVEQLRRAVWVEVVVGVLVLALTAVLVAQPRGKEALVARDRDPVTVTAPLGDGRAVIVTCDPGTHGEVDLTFTLSGGAAGALTATATQQRAQIGPIPVALSRVGQSTYSGRAGLAVAGAWDIDITVTTSAFDATTTDALITLH